MLAFSMFKYIPFILSSSLAELITLSKVFKLIFCSRSELSSSGNGNGISPKSKFNSDGFVSLSSIMLRLLMWSNELFLTVITSSFSPENNADNMLKKIIIMNKPKKNDNIPFIVFFIISFKNFICYIFIFLALFKSSLVSMLKLSNSVEFNFIL